QALPRLISLQTIFGSDTADSSLIIVAAYKIPGGTVKTHPLLECLRKVVRNPRTDRSVWRLHETNCLNPQAYDLVIRFIALGIISRDPRQYGVDALSLEF